MYAETDSLNKYQDSFLQTIYFAIFQNPLGPLTFGLFLIVLFTYLYQDRGNLSIGIDEDKQSRYPSNLSGKIK